MNSTTGETKPEKKDELRYLLEQLETGSYGLVQIMPEDPEVVALKAAIELREVVRKYLQLSSIDGSPERQELRRRMRELSR